MTARLRWIVVSATLAGAGLLSAVGSAPAVAQTAPQQDFAHRVALVIGNDRYTGYNQLPNTVNDARAVNDALNRMGFDTELVLNAGHETLGAQLDRFVGRLHDGDLAVLYYAGHGMNYMDVNYLIPIDAERDGAALVGQSFSLNNILSRLQRNNVTNVVILDACRNRALGRSLPARRHGRHRHTRAVDTSRGLGLVRTTAGTLIAYSTAPGDVAEDAAASASGGATANSPFADALLRHIEEPRDFEDILRDVRAEVMRATAAGHQQIPWSNSALVGSVVLNGRAAAASRPTPAASQTAAATQTPRPAPPSPPPMAVNTALAPHAQPSFQQPLFAAAAPPYGYPSSTGAATFGGVPVPPSPAPYVPETRGVLVDAERFAPGSQPAELGGSFQVVPLTYNNLNGVALVPNGTRGEMRFPIHVSGDFRLGMGFKINHGCSPGGGVISVAIGMEGNAAMAFQLTFDNSDCMGAGGFSAQATGGGRAPSTRSSTNARSPRFNGGDRTVTILRRGTDVMLEVEGQWVLTVPGAHGAPLSHVYVSVDRVQRNYGPHITRIDVQ